MNEFMTNEIIRLYDEHDKKLKEEFANATEKLRAENSQMRADISQMRTEIPRKDAEIFRLKSLLASAGIPLDESLT